MRRKGKKRLLLGALILTLLAAGIGIMALGAGAAMAPVKFDSDVWAAKCTAYTAENRSRTLSDGTAVLTCGGFTGAEDLWNVPETTDKVTIDHTMTVGQGRAGLVLVSPDGRVIRLWEQEQPYTFSPAAGGMTRLRLIGDKGKNIEATITIRDGDGCWVVG